jgi:hypothetical protein
MVINRRIQHGMPTCLTGLLEVMGHDFAVRNWRQDILHCGHHGHEESQAYGKSCMRLKDSSPAQVKLCVVSGFQDVFLKYSIVFAPQVFMGAIGALASMTVLSAAMGWAAPSLVGISAQLSDENLSVRLLLITWGLWAADLQEIHPLCCSPALHVFWLEDAL